MKEGQIVALPSFVVRFEEHAEPGDRRQRERHRVEPFALVTTGSAPRNTSTSVSSVRSYSSPYVARERQPATNARQTAPGC